MKTQLTLLAALLLATTAAAKGEYAEIARLRAMNETVRGIRPMADGEHYTRLERNEILRYAYAADTPGERLLPASAQGIAVTDYAFSPDERRRILIASGRTPIYRHSYTTTYHHLVEQGAVRPVLRAKPRRPATRASRPTARRSPTPTATTSTSATSTPTARSASPTTGRGTR